MYFKGKRGDKLRTPEFSIDEEVSALYKLKEFVSAVPNNYHHVVGLHSHHIGVSAKRPPIDEILRPASAASSAPRVRVNIIAARGIPARGWDGASDPYCSCGIPGKPNSFFETWPDTGSFRTQVFKNTLATTWDHSREVVDYSVEDPLEFQVWRRCTGEKAQLLGETTLFSSEFWPGGFSGEVRLETPLEMELRREFKLDGTDIPKITSRLQLQIEVLGAPVIEGQAKQFDATAHPAKAWTESVPGAGKIMRSKTRTQKDVRQSVAAGIGVGSILLCHEDEHGLVEIFRSPYSHDVIGMVAECERVEASGKPMLVDGHLMVPIKPEGAIDLDYFENLHATRRNSQIALNAIRAMAAQVVVGRVLVCHENEHGPVRIFKSADSHDMIGLVPNGNHVEASGGPVEVDGHFMVPIKPEGAIQLDHCEFFRASRKKTQMEQDAIRAMAAQIVFGSVLTCHEGDHEHVEIFKSPHSHEVIGMVSGGDRVEASGKPVQADGYMMVPIMPRGAVQLDLFQMRAKVKALPMQTMRMRITVLDMQDHDALFADPVCSYELLGKPASRFNVRINDIWRHGYEMNGCHTGDVLSFTMKEGRTSGQPLMGKLELTGKLLLTDQGFDGDITLTDVFQAKTVLIELLVEVLSALGDPSS